MQNLLRQFSQLVVFATGTAMVVSIAVAPSVATAANDHVPMSGPINLMDTKVPGIPGERTCFWDTGPFSGDPHLNIAYPDTNTAYWAAKFSTPPGARLTIEGQFPHSRYSSFTTYDMRGQPVETLADYLIEPLPGHTNPARDGADRTAVKRSYEIEVLPSGTRDLSRPEGIYLQGKTAKLLSAPRNDGDQQVVILRVYTPDKGAGIAGGVPLPTPVLTLADGKVLRGNNACKALNASQTIKIAPDAVGMPAWRYRELLTLPGKPDTHPAARPATWHAAFDRNSIEAIFTGDTSKVDITRKSEGFYPTVDNSYIRTFTNRKFGPIFVMRGKLPRTPQTMNGNPVMVMSNVDMRYWSICSQKGFGNTMVNQCLNDEQLVLDAERNYTIVMSRAADRPRTAYPECGINWLRQADDGDGLYDADQGNIMIRNMLVMPGFKQTTRDVAKPGDEKQTMGPYLPSSFYLVQATFESMFPCRSPVELARIAAQSDEADVAHQAARRR